MAETIKVAIVGCGGMSHAHAQWLKNIPEAEVVALCDIHRGNMETLWRKHWNADKSIKLYPSMDALLKSPPKGLRLIEIITPHALHYPQAMAALKAGYDVLVEKPMVVKADHAVKLARQIQKSGRLLQIAFQASYSAEFQYIRDVIARGELGEIQTISAFSCQRWLTYLADPKTNWRLNPKMSGGGQMYDTGAHVFNAIAWVMNQPVSEVYCTFDKKGSAVDINSAVVLKWKNGTIGSISICANTPGWQEGIVISGSKGRITTGLHGGRLEHINEGGQVIKYPPVQYAHYTPDHHMIECLLGRATPLCPARYGILHSHLMDGLYESAKLNRPIALSEPWLPEDKNAVVSTSAKHLSSMRAVDLVANPC